MSKSIRHAGTVESVGQGSIVVRILQASACASCEAARLCRSSENKEKLIDVPVGGSVQYHVGQQVVIEAPLNTGLKAVWWAYVYPLVFLMLTVMVAYLLGANEPTIALLGLLSVVSAMLTLYVRRDRLRRQFMFTIVQA